MEFKKTIFKVKFEDTDYEIRKPNVEELESFQQRFDSEDNTGASKTVRKFLEELGLPYEVSGRMEMNHLQTLVDHLADRKNS